MERVTQAMSDGVRVGGWVGGRLFEKEVYPPQGVKHRLHEALLKRVVGGWVGGSKEKDGGGWECDHCGVVFSGRGEEEEEEEEAFVATLPSRTWVLCHNCFCSDPQAVAVARGLAPPSFSSSSSSSSSTGRRRRAGGEGGGEASSSSSSLPPSSSTTIYEDIQLLSVGMEAEDRGGGGGEREPPASAVIPIGPTTSGLSFTVTRGVGGSTALLRPGGGGGGGGGGTGNSRRALLSSLRSPPPPSFGLLPLLPSSTTAAAPPPPSSSTTSFTHPVLHQLTEMGFPEEHVRGALHAAVAASGGLHSGLLEIEQVNIPPTHPPTRLPTHSLIHPST